MSLWYPRLVPAHDDLPKRCVDLTPEQVTRALASSPAMRTLLEHLAKVARPKQGAAKILIPLARMASTECDWLDGGLTVEIVAEGGDQTCILVAIDLGVGIRELLFPRLYLEVPIDEIMRAIRESPELVFPLTSRINSKGALVLQCGADVVGTIAPPSFAISEASLRRSLPAKLRRSLPPLDDAEDRSRRGEAAILAQIRLQPLRPVVVDEEAELDFGWDLGAYSSGVGQRETKPPAEPKATPTASARPSSDRERPSSRAPAAAKKKSIPPAKRDAPVPRAPLPKRPQIVKRSTKG